MFNKKAARMGGLCDGVLSKKYAQND